jgi:hypothetical protein
MTSLDISSNRIGQLVRPDGWQLKKGGTFSASKWVHLDGRTRKDEPLEPLGAIAVASAIKHMGALAKFIFTGDDNSKSVTMQTTMTVADFSAKGLGVSGAIMLSVFLPKCT